MIKKNKEQFQTKVQQQGSQNNYPFGVFWLRDEDIRSQM